MNHSVLQALISRQRDRFEHDMQALLQLVTTNSNQSRNKVISSFYDSIRFFITGLNDVGIELKNTELTTKDLLEKMNTWETFTELKEYVVMLARHLYQEVELSGTSKEANQMRLIKEYIHQHYNENINLARIASMVYMNSYYFSSFFKKHTNQNFKQYLTDIRMKEAIKLLLNTDMMVYEVAEKVGYNNSRQFSDMFKKHYGKLPNEFRIVESSD